MPFQTEIQFTLPKGYMSSEGTLHREGVMRLATAAEDRKSTRLNSSHSQISYAVFCLKKKTCTRTPPDILRKAWRTPYLSVRSTYIEANYHPSQPHQLTRVHPNHSCGLVVPDRHAPRP